jgi:uncharacterized protein involved in exopolysaccharide biosynthesis
LAKSIKDIKTEFAGLFSKNEPTVKTEPTDADLKIMLATGIQSGIAVSGGKQSQIINISYTSPDPKEAAEIINAISDAYIQFGLESRLGEVKNTESWLGEQYILLKEKLQASESKLAAYRSQQGLVDTDQQQRIGNTQLQSLNNELIRAKTELSAAEEQYFAIRDVQGGSKDFHSIEQVLQNKTANEMVKSRANASQRLSELSVRYGEKHPKMISARSELKSAQSNFSREVEKNYK